MNWILAFFLGVYLTGAGFTFAIACFGCILGGDSLWKSFPYALIWPIAMVWEFVSFFKT